MFKNRFFSDHIKRFNDKKNSNQKILNLLIDFKKYLDDLNQSKNQGVFVTAVCDGVLRLACFEVDSEVREIF